MCAYIKTHQSLYEGHFGVRLMFVNTATSSSHCATSGDAGSEKWVFLQACYAADDSARNGRGF